MKSGFLKVTYCHYKDADVDVYRIYWDWVFSDGQVATAVDHVNPGVFSDLHAAFPNMVKGN